MQLQNNVYRHEPIIDLGDIIILSDEDIYDFSETLISETFKKICLFV